MRLVIESTICDACLAWKGTEVDEGVEAVTVGPGRTLALCPEHREGTSRVFALVAEFAEGGTGRRKRNGAAVAHRAAPTSGVPAVTDRPNRRGGARARARRNNSAPVARIVEVADEHAVGECPLCGHVSPTTSALRMHLSDRHSTTASALYGRVCPLCEAEALTTGALGVHGSTSHGVPRGGGVVGLFAMARAEGDPRGVIASRAAAVVEAATS
jgi:hypothetical protein